MNVAQLKQETRGRLGLAYKGFHVRMNVAQLKRSLKEGIAAAFFVFPRSNERGSIEAMEPTSKV